MNNYKHWTFEEWAKAQEMARAGATPAEIGSAIGKTKRQVRDRFNRLGVFLKGDHILRIDVGERPVYNGVALADEQINERETRHQAAMRRSLTARFCGDPPPGFRALDGKVGMT